MNQHAQGQPDHHDRRRASGPNASVDHGRGGPKESLFGVTSGYSYPGIRRDTHRMARVFAAAFALVVLVCIVGTLISVYL